MNHLVKLSRYKKELAQFKKGELVIPRRVQIDPVSYCNHDCQFCTYRYTRDADMNALFDLKDMIPYPKFIEILDDCVELDIKAIELTGGGEPSLHREFVDILKEINDRNIEIGLITNGAWRPKYFDLISDQLQTAEWVRFSLDAATPETHKKTHSSKTGDFEIAISAIQSLIGGETTVGISFIVQNQNVHEIEDAVKLAEELKVDYIRLGGVMFEGTERIDHMELTLEEHVETMELIKKLQSSYDVNIIDNFADRSCTDFERYETGDTCYYSYLGTVIGADLRLYPCCIWKYRPGGVIADLNEVRLADAWLSRAIDKFYESFDIGEKCKRCYLKDKNDFVHLILQDEIEHVNFV